MRGKMQRKCCYPECVRTFERSDSGTRKYCKEHSILKRRENHRRYDVKYRKSKRLNKTIPNG